MAKYKLPKIQEMIDAGVHFGHQVKRWHPKMESYIYTVNKNIHIIDLEKTEKMLERACEFLYEQAALGKVIVFVGTKRQSREVIESEAKRCGALHVNERWVGGTITNFDTIKKNIDKLLDSIKGKEEGRFSIYTKKERLLIDREIEKLQIDYGGISSLKKTPDVLFVIDPKREKTAVREARRADVPVVAIVDTNVDPTEVNYPIPANDDAIKSVALIVGAISDAIEEGYKEFGKTEKEKKEKQEKEEQIREEMERKEAEDRELEAKKSEKSKVSTESEEAIPEDMEDIAKVEEKLVEEVVKEEHEKIIKEVSAGEEGDNTNEEDGSEKETSKKAKKSK